MAHVMIMSRGLGRSSHIAGASVHNQDFGMTLFVVFATHITVYFMKWKKAEYYAQQMTFISSVCIIYIFLE